MGTATRLLLSGARVGETATKRNVHSIETRATAAHDHHNLTITLGVDEPILHKNAADVGDSSEPSKDLSRDFRRRRRVNVYAEAGERASGSVYQNIE